MSVDTQQTPYASAAPLYLEAGWADVIPLPPAGKWPPPAGYTGADGRDPTRSEVEDWVRGKQYRTKGTDGVPLWHDPSNLALRLPDGYCAIDADLYKEGASERLAELEQKLGKLPPTWVATSRSDGSGKRLYRIPPGTRLKNNIGFGEIIQHHHRYVMAWPSLNGDDDNHPVAWVSPTGEPVEDVVPTPEDIAWLPPKWLDYLTGKNQDGSDGGSSTKDRATGDWARVVKDVLADTVASLNGKNGSRHDNALRAALALAGYEHREYPGATDALEALGRAFTAAIADRSDAGDGAAEWERIVDTAREKAPSTTACPWKETQAYRQQVEAALLALVPSGKLDGASGESYLLDPAGENSEESGRPHPTDVSTWAESQRRSEQEYVVADLIPQGGVFAVSGEEGDGKTTAAEQIMREMVRGNEVLGFFEPGTVRPQRLLFIDTEMVDEEARPRWGDMERRGLGVDKGQMFWVCTGALNLDKAEDQAYVDELIRSVDADFLWIDAAGSVVTDPKDDLPVRAFFNWLQGHIRRGQIVAAGLTLHPRKRAQGEYYRRFDDLFGSREWKGKISVALFIEGTKVTGWKDRGRGLHRRWPLGPGQRYPTATLHRTGETDGTAVPFIVEPKTPEPELDVQAAKDKAVELVRERPNHYTKSSLIEALGIRATDARSVVGSLLADGRLGPDKRAAKLMVVEK